MSAAGIDIEGVHVAYGDNAVLRDIDVAIAPGELFALLGPSGSGKSTLLRLIAGFVHAQRGSVRIGGRDVESLPPWKRDVGMVFQNYALWPHLTVAQNVAFGLEERRWPRDRIRARVAEMLSLVGLSELGARRPSQLSGGQQQRVAIARTLAIEPSVLLLDEPLSNLDAKLREATGQELRKLQRRLGLTTVFVTHDQQEAMTIADRLAVLDQGVIQQVGAPHELYDQPANRFVAEFVGSVNLLSARIEAADGALHRRVDVIPLGRIVLPPLRLARGVGADAQEVALAFRPHAVRRTTLPASDALAFEADVASALFLGEFVRYELRVGDTRVLADVPHERFGQALAPGTRAAFHVPASELFALPA
jgi:iron(III) transport system ATP-binding protein